MYLNIFSFVMAILWGSIFTCLISLLRKQIFFLNIFSIYSLLFLLLLCFLRFILPVELPFTKVINSTKIYPFIQKFFCTPFLEFDFIKVDLLFVLILLWGVGIFILIFRYVQTYLHFRHFVDFLPRIEDRHIDEIFAKGNPQVFLKNAKIVIHDSIDSPGIFGFFRPAILLPNFNFTDDELLVIFAHESAHHHYGHNIIKCIATLILSCFWWNPFFKNMTSELAHALELHADKFVCKSLKETQYETYLFCIAKVASHVQKPFSAITCSFVEEKENKKIKQRFQMILDNMYHRKKKSSFLIIPVFIGMFFLSYTIILQPCSQPDKSELDLINLIKYYIQTEDGYDAYDSRNTLILHIDSFSEDTENLQIYKNKEDIPQ